MPKKILEGFLEADRLPVKKWPPPRGHFFSRQDPKQYHQAYIVLSPNKYPLNKNPRFRLSFNTDLFRSSSPTQ